MKDAYTFDRDEAGLAEGYDKHIVAYDRIFDRCRARVVPGRVGRRDDGRPRRTRVHGAVRGGRERGRARAGLRGERRDRVGRAAASSSWPAPAAAPEEVSTPGLTTVDEVAGALERRRPARCSRPSRSWSRTAGMVLALVRGDHRVNEIKLQNALGAPFRVASREEVAERIGPAGLHRPGRRRRRHRCSTTRCGREGGPATSPAPTGRTLTCAASCPAATSPFERGGHPPRGARRPRRRQARSASSRRSRSATSSSSARATPSRSTPPTSTRTAREQLIWMGSYGIGPARIAAAAVEQFADEHGISLAAGAGALRRRARRARQAGQRGARARRSRSTTSCAPPASTCSTTTATPAPGEKFADAELLGCPLR